MREILRLCIELDTHAAETYSNLAEHCTDSDVTRTFRQMGAEETVHVGWWTELLEAWDAGLVPDIADESDLMGSLVELSEEIDRLTPADCSIWRHTWSSSCWTLSSADCSIW